MTVKIRPHTAGWCRRLLCAVRHAAGPILLAIVPLWAIPAHAQAAPDDNPFGLPAADDAAHPGSVMLHGGGSGLADEMRQEFVRLAGGRDARIVLLPSDMTQRGQDEDGRPLASGETISQYEQRLAQPAQYGRWADLAREKKVASFQFIYRDPANEADDAQFFAALEQATGVWLPAYDQLWLPSQFVDPERVRPSRFELALRNVVARGGVVGGLGGGMASLPETIIVQDAPSDGGWVRGELALGLGLLTGAVVDQNFDSHAGRLERLTDLLRAGPRLDRLARKPGVERRTIGLGVERQTAAILQGNTVRALGAGRVHVLLKGNGDRTITWRTLAAGDDPLVVQATPARPTDHDLHAHETIEHQNPFGMPEPIAAGQWGTVVLHGGGDTDEIIAAFPALTRAAKPHLVHCPAARESCRPSAEFPGPVLAARLEDLFSEWRLETDGRAAEMSFVTTNTPADANRAEFVAPIARADGLWFCGGEQKPLADLFVDPLRPTLFQQAAWDIVRRGGAVGGSSAGLAIMADVMIEGGEPVNGRAAKADLSRGLGLLKRVLAEQHFDTRGGRIERLTGLLGDHKRLANFSPTSDVRRMIALAVEEDTALLVRANRLQVVGGRQAHVFCSDDPRLIIWHALKPGDAALVRPGPHGFVLELEDWQFAE